MTFSTKPLTPIPFGIAFSLKVGFLGGLVVKNPSANAGDKEIQSLDRENPLEETVATHSSILDCENPMVRGAWRAIVHGVIKGLGMS